MITCMACTKREGKFTAEGADPFRVRSHYLLNLCQGKPGSVLFDPACTFKGGHALAGYSMETALDIMRGNRATTDGIAGNAGARGETVSGHVPQPDGLLHVPSPREPRFFLLYRRNTIGREGTKVANSAGLKIQFRRDSWVRLPSLAYARIFSLLL